MKTKFTVNEELLRKAAMMTGVTDMTVLINMALDVLIAQESARRLARLGGSEPGLEQIRRRRPRIRRG